MVREKEVPVIPGFSLCRFRLGELQPRLGLIADAQLYDLAALDNADYASFEAWLKSAGGRVSQAFAELDRVIRTGAERARDTVSRNVL